MAEWNNNNRACTVLWTSLYIMRQLTTNFSDSGALPMSELIFFSSVDSDDLRAQNAYMVADQLDSIFRRGGFGATFENGVDGSTAITGMVSILIDSEKTVADLAEAIDVFYAFWQEHHDQNNI